MDEKIAITKLPHHIQQKLCYTRPPYRQGKTLTSVKVYTINDESKHLMICGVPKLQLGEEIKSLVESYGSIKTIHVASDYPTEEFTDAYYILYDCIQSARIAKRFIDGKNFYGGSLHVFYVPELESIAETRDKLLQRLRDVSLCIKRNQQDMLKPNAEKFVVKNQYHRRKKTPALPLTQERLSKHYPGETLSSICDGIPQSIDPRPITEPSVPSTSGVQHTIPPITSILSHAPYHLNEPILRKSREPGSADNKNKRKNYKGQHVHKSVKVRVLRPQLVDTSTIIKWKDSNTHVFSNPKKIDNNITIKLVPRNDGDKKKIVIKDPSVSQLVQPCEDLQLSIREAKSQIRAVMQVMNKQM